MQTVAPQHATVEFDVALRYAASLARMRYIGEADRIDRGLVLALNGHVTFQEDGTALVRSGSDYEVVYHVNGRCDCKDVDRAPASRCKHAFAKALVKKAHVLMAPPPPSPQFWATYYPPSGAWISGTAEHTSHGWLFRGEAGEEPQYVASEALCLGGNIALANAQHAVDVAALAQAWTAHLLQTGCQVAQE